MTRYGSNHSFPSEVIFVVEMKLSSGELMTLEVAAASTDDAEDIALQLAKEYELKHHEDAPT
jgi:hypothetical protein